MIKFEKKDEPPKQSEQQDKNRINEIRETAIARRRAREAAPPSNDQLSGKNKES